MDESLIAFLSKEEIVENYKQEFRRLTVMFETEKLKLDQENQQLKIELEKMKKVNKQKKKKFSI